MKYDIDDIYTQNEWLFKKDEGVNGPDSNELEELVQEFLANGGEITKLAPVKYIPNAQLAQELPLNTKGVSK